MKSAWSATVDVSRTSVAAVVSGPRTDETQRQMKITLRDIEADKELGPILANWDGSMEKVRGAEQFVQDLLAGKYRRRR